MSTKTNTNNIEKKSNWFTQHADTIAIVSIFVSCFWMLNSKISVMEKDITVIKTVLCLKNIMPAGWATNSEEQK